MVYWHFKFVMFKHHFLLIMELSFLLNPLVFLTPFLLVLLVVGAKYCFWYFLSDYLYLYYFFLFASLAILKHKLIQCIKSYLVLSMDDKLPQPKWRNNFQTRCCVCFKFLMQDEVSLPLVCRELLFKVKTVP
jgi:hypothetical protein